MSKTRTRIGSLLLAVLMLFSLLPVSALAAEGDVAQIGDNTYATLQQAFDSAQDGDTVILLEDITLTPQGEGTNAVAQMHIRNSITLDLNGKKIGYDLTNVTEATSLSYTPILIGIENGASVTLTGNGIVDAEYKNNNSFGINIIDNSSLTVENGTYTGATTAIQVQSGTLIIEGGTFKQATTIATADTTGAYKKYIINCIDSAYADGTARIYAQGGTFCFDPSDKPENSETTYVPVDYISTKNESGNDATWTVSPKDTITVETKTVDNVANITVSGMKIPDPDDDEDVSIAEQIITVDAMVITDDITSANVTVGGTALNTVKKADNVSSLEIKTNVGTLMFDETALNTIVSNASVGTETAVVSDVTLSIEKKTGTQIYTLTAVDAAGREVFAPGNSGGTISVTVNYTGKATPSIYYLGNGSVEKVADVTLEEGKLTWSVSHFSDWLISETDYAVAYEKNDSGWAFTNDLATALSGVKDNGTITLLKDIKLDNVITSLTVSSNKTVTIQSAEGQQSCISATYTGEQAGSGHDKPILDLGAGSTLTLSNVRLDFQSTLDSGEEKYLGDGIRCGDKSQLCLTNGTAVELSDLYRAFVHLGSNGTSEQNQVILDDATLTVSHITANASNGGSWTIQHDSKVTFTDIGNHALSTEKLTVDSSEVTVDRAGYLGIYGSEITLRNGAEVSVQNSATDESLPEGYKGNGAVQLKGATGESSGSKLTVTNATLSLSGNGNGSQTNEQTVFIGTGSLTISETGAVDGTPKYTLDEDQYAITYLVNDQVYWTDVVSANEGTINYTEPADPVVSGYIFEGWDYGEVEMTETADQVSFKPTSDQNTYTFTAVLRRNSSSGGPSVTSYSVQVSDMTNGQVLASKKIAQRGEEVTLTVTPAEGYELGTLTVTDRNGEIVTLNQQTGGTYTFVMPASNVTIRATFVETEPAEPTLPFIDVAERDWFYDAVAYVYENELMNGITATTFGPNVTTTRGMIVAILWRQEGQPAAADSTFTDVAGHMYYAEAIAWAERNGIVNGVSETEFAPDRAITREEMAAILYRYAEYKGYDTTGRADLSAYTDEEAISPYAVAAMQWANAEDVIQGVTTTTLVPQGSAIRAQVATMLMRFLESHAA